MSGSNLSNFVSTARALGLTVPASPAQLGGSPVYREHLAAKRSALQTRNQYANSISHGRLGPLKPEHVSARTDSKGKQVPADQVAFSAALVWQWAEALANLPGERIRTDALVPVASQALTYFRDTLIEIVHADLPAWEGKILPIDRKVDRAAEDFVWYEYDLVGVARAGNSYSRKDIPMVAGPMGQANKGNIMPFLVGMEVNFMDMRRAALSNLNGKPDFQIDLNKMRACERALAEAINFLWLYGDSVKQIDGLMNHPSIGMLSLNGAWSAKTPLQILDDLTAIVNIVPDTTQGQIGGNGNLSKAKFFFPPSQYNKANSVPVTAAGDITVLDFWKKTWGLRDDQVIREYDFSAAGSQLYIGGPQGLDRDRGLIFFEQGNERDPRFILSQDVEIPAPPAQNGLSETTFYHARAGGCMVPDARGIRFIEGF